MKSPKIIFLAAVLTFSLLLSGCADEKKPVAIQEKTIKETPLPQKVQEELKVNEMIHIDQIGYRPADKKVAAINGKGGKFEIVDEKSGKAVYSGEATGGISDASSGDTVFYADFSGVQAPGSYYVAVPGFGKSYPFKVEDNVYRSVKDAMLKFLYYQRCGTALEEKYAGVWNHGVCHNSNGYIFGTDDKELDGLGGWHDAGDYGRYASPGATTVGYLLMAYELFPEAFKEDINIPESGNNVPDILDECRYELEWLLKMQDKATGGVYHKLSTTYFPDFSMPELDIGDLYFAPISPTATGDFAAVMAKAARDYKAFDAAFSEKCLKAAQKAWKWLGRNKNVPGYKNPPEITTGEYGDEDDSDERFWAAAELYRTTGGKEYHEYFKQAVETDAKLKKDWLGWQDIGFLGTAAYLFAGEDKEDNAGYESLKNWVLEKADEIAEKGSKDGYGIAIAPEEYRWGSNMDVMNRAIFLITANMLSPKEAYVKTAQDQLHYLFGRNALDQSYLTGYGSKSIKNPHHRPTVADSNREPVPAMVAGGPNKDKQDGYSMAHLDGVPSARCYADDPGAYSLNEVTVYWNAAAVFVAGFFDK